MELRVKLKLFVLLFLGFFKVSEQTSIEPNTTPNISNATNVTITIEPNNITDFTKMELQKSNVTDEPKTAVELNKNYKRVTIEASTEVLQKVQFNDTKTTSIHVEKPAKTIETKTECVNTENTEQQKYTTNFSEVSFIFDDEETTTVSTIVKKRHDLEKSDQNENLVKTRVTKESHWSEDDAIDRFAEEAQTVRIATKVKDRNWPKNNVESDTNLDLFERFIFKPSARLERNNSNIQSLGYISSVLSNRVYPIKNKESTIKFDVSKKRFFDNNIIRPSHQIDRIRFHKNFPNDNDKENDVRQVNTNTKNVYSIGDHHKPKVVGFVEALSSNTKIHLPYYVSYRIPKKPERKIMKKFFRKIFETKPKNKVNDYASSSIKESLLHVDPVIDKTYSKEMKESLENSLSDLGEGDKTSLNKPHEKGNCDIFKQVYLTRSIDKKIANLERLFLKLYGVIMNGGSKFSKDTIRSTNDKPYFYIVSENKPQKRSLHVLEEKPSKIINFVNVDCDTRGHCGLKRFRKSVSNETSLIDEVHKSLDTTDVSTMLESLLNETKAAMNKLDSNKFHAESFTPKKIEPKLEESTEHNDKIESKIEIKEPARIESNHVVKPVPPIKSVPPIKPIPPIKPVTPVHQVSQEDSSPSLTGYHNNLRKNRTELYKFKKHRFIPSPRTEETLKKLKSLIHKYNLLENTFVKRIYESMKKAQKVDSTEPTLPMQYATYVPRIYRNKYEMAKHSKQIMERLRMARDFAQTMQQQSRRERRQLKELTENQNHTLMLMDFLMEQDFPLEVTHEDDYVDFMTEIVANAHYLKQPKPKTTTTTTSKPASKREVPIYAESSFEESFIRPTKKPETLTTGLTKKYEEITGEPTRKTEQLTTRPTKKPEQITIKPDKKPEKLTKEATRAKKQFKRNILKFERDRKLDHHRVYRKHILSRVFW